MAIPTTNLLKINGRDYTKYVVSAGLGWQRNDLDDESSGRTLDGVMHRKRIAQKRILQIKMKRMGADMMRNLVDDLKPQTLTVYYPNPEVFFRGTAPLYTDAVYTDSMTVYGTQANGTLVFADAQGDTFYWDEISFQLTEV